MCGDDCNCLKGNRLCRQTLPSNEPDISKSPACKSLVTLRVCDKLQPYPRQLSLRYIQISGFSYPKPTPKHCNSPIVIADKQLTGAIISKNSFLTQVRY